LQDGGFEAHLLDFFFQQRGMGSAGHHRKARLELSALRQHQHRPGWRR
jgi:hypothetical protein